LKTIGGKKRVAAIKDATYEWNLIDDKAMLRGPGTIISQIKTPASTHMIVSLTDKQEYTQNGTTRNTDAIQPLILESGANARSVWAKDPSGSLRTLTDSMAHTAKLQSILDSTHLLDYKKSKILARTVGVNESFGEPAYKVEFSLRNGARLLYWFSVSRKLLLATEDQAREGRRTFSDYKEVNGLLEPHQLRWSEKHRGEYVDTMVWSLQRVRYNTGLSNSLFDPPTSEKIDVSAILKEIEVNQEQVDERVGDYTYIEKRTERKINDKGEVTEESVTLFEVYPVPGVNDVRKLISENGVMLSPEKASKEEKRVTEELEKAQRGRASSTEKRRRDKLKGKRDKSNDDDLGVADFLRVVELVSPRREKLRERDAIVFDFRPRTDYKAKNRVESIVSKLAGVMWIDPVDKQVIRLEARFMDSYKMGGGLLASVSPGTALIFEQKRMDDGVWLPVYTQANISARVLLFKSINVNVVQEFSNYQRFNSNVDDYKLTSPDEKSSPSP